jgi:hypothetical protein
MRQNKIPPSPMEQIHPSSSFSVFAVFVLLGVSVFLSLSVFLFYHPFSPSSSYFNLRDEFPFPIKSWNPDPRGMNTLKKLFKLPLHAVHVIVSKLVASSFRRIGL